MTKETQQEVLCSECGTSKDRIADLELVLATSLSVFRLEKEYTSLSGLSPEICSDALNTELPKRRIELMKTIKIILTNK